MLFAGFDAGQTRTRCRISRWTADGWMTVCEGQGSGVCHLDAPDGAARFRAAVGSSLKAALGQRDALELDAAVIGASGIEQGTELQHRAGDLVAQELLMPPDHVLATGDERTALHGAFPDSPGIVLISGTGMICIGRNARGEEARSGGWGWLLDGAGAAFDLGHQGLQLSLRMADGRLPDHPLRQRLWKAMHCHSSAQVKAMVVNPDFGAAGFAALAPLVVTAAEEGLVEASHILRRSAHALTECVITVGGRLELTDPQLAARGGAIEHLQGYRRVIEDVLSHQFPQARWSAASGDACDGALTLARGLRQR